MLKKLTYSTLAIIVLLLSANPSALALDDSLKNSRLKAEVLTNDSGNYIYANNKDAHVVDIAASDKVGNLLLNQSLSIWMPTGVSCGGNLNTGSGSTRLSCISSRSQNARITLKLTNDERVRTSFSLNFRRIDRRIYNRTDNYFNINSPITLVAETSPGAGFVRGEVVYEYTRRINRIFGTENVRRSVVIPMTRNDNEWLGTVSATNTAYARVSGLRFSYYYRLFDENGQVFYSRRYSGRLSTNYNW